jgi:hypothetical protein
MGNASRAYSTRLELKTNVSADALQQRVPAPDGRWFNPEEFTAQKVPILCLAPCGLHRHDAFSVLAALLLIIRVLVRGDSCLARGWSSQ